MDEERSGERRRGGHQAIEEIGVEDRRRRAEAFVAEEHRHAGDDEQQIAECARPDPALAQADPDEAGTFERPRASGAALVERERDDEGEEHGRDRQAGLEGDAELGPVLHPGGKRDVEAGENERSERGAERRAADQAVLEREGDRRQAEQKAAVDPEVAARHRRVGRRELGVAPRRQDEDDNEEHEERDQEALARREVLGLVLEHAPRGRDDEGSDEADQVERPPGLRPGHQSDAGVENEVVREQSDVVVRSGRDDERRREAAEGADDGQRARVLEHRERGGERGDGHHQHEGGQCREHAVVAERGEQREVEHRDRAALEHLRIVGTGTPQAPAEAEQDDGRGTDRRQPHLDRQMRVLARVLGEKGKADEEDADTGLDDRVAAEEPALDRRERIARRRMRHAVAGDRPGRCDEGGLVDRACWHRLGRANHRCDGRDRLRRFVAGSRRGGRHRRHRNRRCDLWLRTLAQRFDLALLAQRTHDQPTEKRPGERSSLAARGEAHHRRDHHRDQHHHVVSPVVVVCERL